jgi:2-dehydropantoate 2-reductase
MSPTEPRIAVVGAGAIGGISAAGLARAGHEIDLVCKHRDIAKRAKEPGLHVFGIDGDFVAPVNGIENISQLQGAYDLIFLATKATDVMQAAGELLPFLKTDSLVVSQQNGICEQALASALGQERVVGCVVGFGATMHGAAELEKTSDGEFVIGSLGNEQDPRLGTLKQLMDLIAPTRISNNILGELYAKLIINSCINSLGAMSGLYLGEMLAKKRARRIFIAIMREAMAVAEAMELEVAKGAGGKLDYYDFLDNGAMAEFKRHLMIRLIGFKYRRLKSSSLQSLERGKPTEIDYLNGYIAGKGRELGVPTPINAHVIAVIKAIEAEERRMDPAILYDPAFDLV